MEPSSAMKELHKMVATSAIHDGKRDKQDYTDVCHPGTREEYLENLKAWAEKAPPETRVEWVNAIAGAGKTAVLRTFCTLLEEQDVPPFSFFVWKGDAKRNTLEHFPATIAYQLCQTFQVLVPLIEKAINTAPLLLQSAFKKQMDKLVIGPLLGACDTLKDERHIVIVVDGLDELDAKGQTELLNFIPYLLSRLSSLPISLLVSSRPAPQIVGAFNHPKLASITRSTRMGASDADIQRFLEDKFEDINLRHPRLRIEHGVGGKWPGGKKLGIMVKQSSGLFIWPTVAIGHIDKVEKGLGHNARLDQVLSSAEPKPWVGSPLDNLYRAILEAHAPEDRNSFEFLRFKRRLALLCILNLSLFVREIGNQVVDYSDAPVRAIFGETLDELWSSVSGLSSIFLPRKPLLSVEESPTPGILHLSLRDFTFNKERCGEELYYSSERELRAEVVCEFIKFVNTPQGYPKTAEMGAWSILCVGYFLELQLKQAVLSEKLGCCMDDIVLDYIPHTWPLVTQVFTAVHLFGALYKEAANPDFPEGQRRREALLSKVKAFIKIRAVNAQEWDIALFQLPIPTDGLDRSKIGFSHHSVDCWHIARSTQCTCVDAYIRNFSFSTYHSSFIGSTLFQHANSQLANREDDIPKGSLDVLQFFLSLSGTSQLATELSPFIPVSDQWIVSLLNQCPPNDDLYNTLGPICTAPLPDSVPMREEDDSGLLVYYFLWQTDEFNKYTERCREAGIETKFPPIKIPDDWWEDKEVRLFPLDFGYRPPFDIPDEWWEDGKTRGVLLQQEYKPPFDIPEKWWEYEDTRGALLSQGYKPTFDIPEGWWQIEETRRFLRRRGYPPPDPYSAEETASEAEDGESAVQEAATDQHISPQEEPLPDGETLPGVVSPQVLPPPPPVVPLSNPIHIHPVAPAHPTTTPAVGAENTGRRRRGFRDSVKNFFRR